MRSLIPNKTIAKLVKWAVVGVGSIVILAFIGIGVLYMVSNNRMNRSFSVPSHAVPVRWDSVAIAHGRRLSKIRGCVDCHGEHMAGKVVIDVPIVAQLYASNLTSGKGGIGAHYTDMDWERAIRHAVDPEGKPLLFMPAQEFYYLSDQDVAALIAYIKSLPPVDNELPVSTVGPIGRLLYLRGEMPLVPAELTDHNGEHPPAPEPGITVSYGWYLSTGCAGCHRQDFSGGTIPGAPPDWPPAPDLTPAGNLRNWSEQDFIRAMRTGIKPDGARFRPPMPYQALSALTDEELKAIWLFLQSLPPSKRESNP